MRLLFQRIALVLLIVLPIQHMISLFGNLNELPLINRRDYPAWLSYGATAPESLNALHAEVSDGRPLHCSEVQHGCRYSAAFAALQWEHSRLHPGAELPLIILAESPDPDEQQLIRLDRSLWRDYTILH